MSEEQEEKKKYKLKAVDINIESLKLYVTLSIGSIAGLIAYHNSNNINHNETCFYIAVAFLFLTAITGIITLNSFISLVDEGITDVNKKLPMWLNLFAIFFFFVGIASAITYFSLSEKKSVDQNIHPSGITIERENIFIGNDVKTKIKIVKDSNGKIKEIIIPN